MAKNTPVLEPVYEVPSEKGRGKYNIHVGQVWPTRNYGDVEVINLPENDIKTITIRFLKTGNVVDTVLSSLVRGTIKDKLFGVGYNSRGVYGTKGDEAKCHDYWSTMIMRSYSPEYSKDHPTYEKVTVCEDWLDYQNFAKWYHEQKYCEKGYDLDKDLLKVGNLKYSPENCCFLPQEVNKAITIREGVRGYNLHKRDEVYETTYRGEYLGRSSKYSLEKLQEIYLDARHSYVRSLAFKYKNILPPYVLEKLSNYRCEVQKDGIIRRVL